MTDLHDPPLRSSVSARPREREWARPPQPPHPEPAARETAAEPAPASAPPKRPRLTIVAVGGSLAALVLVAYFVWLSIQMGSHAQTGAAPMIAVFASAALGVGAGALAFTVGRRRRR